MGEAQSTRRGRAVPVAEIQKGAQFKRTIHGKAGEWELVGKMQTSKGSYGVTARHLGDGETETFVLGPKGSLWVIE